MWKMQVHDLVQTTDLLCCACRTRATEGRMKHDQTCLRTQAEDGWQRLHLCEYTQAHALQQAPSSMQAGGQ